MSGRAVDSADLAALPVARNSFRASSVPAPPRCRLVSRPKFIFGRPVCLPCPAAALPVARNVFRGVQYACPAPLPPGQSPEMYFGRPVCLPRPAAARSVARNVFRASSMPAPPRCRPVSRPKFISGVQYACPAPLPPGQLPEMYFGRPVCLLRPAAAWSVARNSFRASSVPAPLRCRLVSCPKFISGVQCACPAPLPPGVPAPPRCRLVSRPKFISGVQCACSAPLPPGQLPEIHFGRPVCLPCPPAAWCACPAPLRQSPEIHFGRPVCLPRPAASVARNSFRASSMPAPPRCVSCPKFIAGVQYACPAPLRQSPEIHFGRPVCLHRPAAAWSVARNSFRASSVPAPPRCVSCPKFISGVQCACPAPLRQSPEIHFGRPVCLPRPAASVARNSLRASSVPAPPRCVSRPKFIAGVQYACPAPLRQSPEIHCGRPVCLPRPATAWSVARNSFRASSVPAPPRCRLVSYPKCISGAWCACPAPLPPGQLPEIHFGRPVCLPRPAAAWSVTRNVFRAPGVPAPPRCRLVSCPKFISGVQCACPAPLPKRTIFTPPAPAAI
jgi:hypothetical protein